MSVMTDGKTLL